MAIWAVCVTGHIFLTNAFGGDPGAQFTLSSIGVGPCPICGLPARIPDGSYTINDAGVADILRRPIFTSDALQQLANLSQRAVDEGLSADRVISEAQRINPLFSFLRYWLPTKSDLRTALFWLIGLLVTLTLEKAVSSDPTPVQNITIVQNFEAKPPAPKKQKTANYQPSKKHKPRSHKKKRKRGG